MKSTDLISVFCRPVPFWSWNDKLEPDELRRQIGAMQDAGMGGFFMHARGGLETEYLSEDWFRAAASCWKTRKTGRIICALKKSRALMQPRLAFTHWKTAIFAASPVRRMAFQSISAYMIAKIPPRSISLTCASRMRFLL